MTSSNGLNACASAKPPAKPASAAAKPSTQTPPRNLLRRTATTVKRANQPGSEIRNLPRQHAFAWQKHQSARLRHRIGLHRRPNARQKVGTAGDTYEMGLYDIERDTHYVLDIKQIEGIYEKPAYLAEYHKDTSAYNPKYKNPREVMLHGPVFSEDGKAVVVARALDNKDRWIMQLDPTTGKLKLLDRQHDDAGRAAPVSARIFRLAIWAGCPTTSASGSTRKPPGLYPATVPDVETLEKKALTVCKFKF